MYQVKMDSVITIIITISMEIGGNTCHLFIINQIIYRNIRPEIRGTIMITGKIEGNTITKLQSKQKNLMQFVGNLIRDVLEHNSKHQHLEIYILLAGNITTIFTE